jgi:hypothetical protein
VYPSFKEYVIKTGSASEDILKELLVFSWYYNCIIEAKHRNKDVREILTYLKKLEVNVANPFLLEVFHDSDLGVISDEELLEILLIIESFLVRRLICDVQTNALNKIFMTLGRDIKENDDYKENYVEILKYILSQKRSVQRFPTDEEMKEKMVFKDLYSMNAKNKTHILERLENFENKEAVDLQKLQSDGELTIEHIMPKALNSAWKKELGSGYENIHNKYLNTIGNLTLTAYNSNMQNKPFLEKKTIENGFSKSKLYLNDYVKKQNTWNEENIKERASILIDKSLNIWKSCQTNYQSKHDIDNTYGLDDDYDFTGEKIKYFKLFEQKITVSTWVEFFQKLCEKLYDLEPVKFRNILNENPRYLSNEKSTLGRPKKIAEDLFIEGNQSAQNMLSASRDILKKIDIDIGDVDICVQKKSD